MIKSVTSRTLRARFGVLSAATAAIALLVAPVQAQTFDATADFSITNGNPNGVWAYGFSSGLSGTFTLFDAAGTFVGQNGATVSTFASSALGGVGSVPLIALNNGPSSTFNVPAGSLFLHGGPANTFAVLQFIAPTTATYALSSQFFAGDSSSGLGETSIDVFVNGATGSPIFSSGTTSGNPLFNTSLALGAGDIVSFAVGTAGDGFQFDSTPVSVTFVQQGAVAAPEPATAALLLPVALGGLSLARRRRASK